MLKYSEIMSLTNIGGKLKRMSADEANLLRSLPMWVTEKIHGENFRVGMDEDDNFFIGQRNVTYYKQEDGQYLDENGSPHPRFTQFNHHVLSEIDQIHAYCDAERTPLIFIGELFGNGLQKGFSYTMDGLHVAFFEIRCFDKTYIKPQVAFDLFDKLGLPTVPVIDIMTFQEFLEYDVESLKSKVANEDYVEGIVAIPLDGSPDWWDFGDRLAGKNKIPKFAENQPDDSPKKSKDQYHSPFKQFCTLVRMEHVVQALEEKGMEITSDKECRQRVVTSFVFNIRKEENEMAEFDQKDQKYLTTEGHRLFSKYLSEQVI